MFSNDMVKVMLAVCAVFLIVLFIVLSIYAPEPVVKKTNETDTEETTIQTTTAITTAPPKITVTETPTETTQNATSKLNSIILEAETNAETADEAKLAEAEKWIYDNADMFFINEENMEKALYYGRLLEFKNLGTGNKQEKIGMLAQKAVKFVYRGVDGVHSDATIASIAELKIALGYDNVSLPTYTHEEIRKIIYDIVRSSFSNAEISVSYDSNEDSYSITISQDGIANSLYLIKHDLLDKSIWTNVKDSVCNLCTSTKTDISSAGYNSSVTYTILNDQNTVESLLIVKDSKVTYDAYNGYFWVSTP